MNVRLTQSSIFSLPYVESMISDYSFNLKGCYKKQSTDMLFNL